MAQIEAGEWTSEDEFAEMEELSDDDELAEADSESDAEEEGDLGLAQIGAEASTEAPNPIVSLTP